jgi:hypothetical protein
MALREREGRSSKEEFDWLMGAANNPRTKITEVMEIYNKLARDGFFPERTANNSHRGVLSRLGEIRVASKDLFLRENSFPLRQFLNRRWFKRQFLPRRDGQIPWEESARGLVLSSEIYESAYQRRRLALCLAGSVIFNQRDFPLNLQRDLYVKAADVKSAEESFSGTAAEAILILAYFKKLRERYSLRVGNPSLDLGGIDFLISGQEYMYPLDIKGNRGADRVYFATRFSRNQRIGNIGVVELVIPMLLTGNSHRGSLCVSFPPSDKIIGDISAGLEWMLSFGREGKCLFDV